MKSNNKGSIWRIWDLHVHSPATYGGDYVTFIANASKSKAAVIGVNDYCSIKGYEEVVNLGGIPGKVIFPVVEFRMHNIVANRKNADPTKSGTKINFHLIFNNDPEIFSTISNWLNSLECINEKGETIQLGVAGDLKKVSFDFEHVIASLKKLNLHSDHCLVWLPYDEYGGVDDIDPNDNFFKLSLINKTHIIGSSTKKQIDFFKWVDDKFTIEQYQSWFDKPKPCIKGSDAHKIDYPFGHLMNSQSQPTDKHCWINADMTFKGLKQIIVEPDRVFIGDEPNLLKRVRANRTKFIKSISVKKIAGTTVDDVWFDNFDIELNSSLVAIIGNKGGGKSAITDIIGLCGNTHQEPINFSFLHKDKFRKPKPSNLSEKFEAILLWEDGTTISKKLNENPDKVLAERVKYIPQNFLERLCANVESDEFEKELKQIIYSHTPNDKRLGKSSLDELINYKSSLVNSEISQIQTEISNLNLTIVSLENKATANFKKTLENQLEIKKGELIAHATIQPKKPEVGNESEESKKLVEKLTQLRDQIKTLEEEVAELKKNKTALSIKKEELNRSLQYYKNIDEQLTKAQAASNEFVQILIKNGILQADVFSFKIDTTQISTLIASVSEEIAGIDVLLDSEIKNSKTSALKKLNEGLKQGQEILDKPAKEQQKFLDDLKNWEAKKKELEGSSEIEGTLNFYQAQLFYLNEKLIPELTSSYAKRKIFLAELYSKKLSLIEIRRELFQPVTQFINDFKELKKRYDVKIDVALELRSFTDNFFTYVNQNRVGTFCGKEEGYKKLFDIIEKTHFNTSQGFIEFTEELIENLKKDKRNSENTSVDINSQLRKGVELNQLYDYIHNSEFLQPVYNLKLGTKTLAELSPGERGALLLIFYLILDNDDIPLIIDQPEENLDNESVYHILVHFIKKVKEKRQIIIVTHNPNLAVVCDADQIVNMQIEKENKNKVKFNSGAIEDEVMNKAIVNILEGTLPAFNNRDSKYVRI
jgi:ABC-type lipoprotein export system ATPase subunit